MNFSLPDPILGRQRCRQWIPLITQQLRLRHLYQVMAYNVAAPEGGSLYYTLHLTTMCAPFYTSEKSDNCNPKWAELDMSSLLCSSVSGFVIRIWQTQGGDCDNIITTWGINFSGLVYLGTKLSEIQPESFKENSVILYMRGGFFVPCCSLRQDLMRPLHFIDNLNVMSTEVETKIYRNIISRLPKSDVKQSYVVSKLQKIHSLQIAIKNQSQDVEILRGKIINKCGLCNPDEVPDLEQPSPVHRSTSQLLTMTTLNKMLQWQGKPTKVQRQKIANVNKQIETAKFKAKLLSHERDKKSAQIRMLKQKHSTLEDKNAERGSQLMENYHKLSRDTEKLKENRKEYVQFKEMLMHSNTHLHNRRRQLMNQLLSIYPVEQASTNKFTINGIYLPDSEMLSDCSDGGLAVSLGYVAHVLLMCSFFMQAPLRYPISYFGSRSNIVDHITAALTDKDRSFPLYTKGKDRMQFNYAVYLLNKNIAQLRWLCGQHTPDLRATLPNLLSLLKGRDGAAKKRESDLPKNDQACSEPSEQVSPFHRRNRTKSDLRSEESCQREILSVPEAYMSRQISQRDFKSYIATERRRKQRNEEEDHAVELDPDIEQGTDILHSSLNIAENKSDIVDSPIVEEKPKSIRQTNTSDRLVKQSRRISRSVGSITDETELHGGLELGSDPLLNLSSEPVQTVKETVEKLVQLEDGQQEFLQKWLDSGPALVCSEENLYPDEILGTAVAVASTSSSSPLTLRTDALANTKSFNLVKK